MIITEEKYNEELTRYVLPFIRLNFEDGYMKSADGTRIHYGYVTTPVAKAAIVISHGFTECMDKSIDKRVSCPECGSIIEINFTGIWD